MTKAVLVKDLGTEFEQQLPLLIADLLGAVASVDPKLRVRFSTSHPKDLSDEVLHTMARYPNLCRAIHLPAQSGASSMLARMNRKYTREWYLDRVAAIRRYREMTGADLYTATQTVRAINRELGA